MPENVAIKIIELNIVGSGVLLSITAVRFFLRKKLTKSFLVGLWLLAFLVFLLPVNIPFPTVSGFQFSQKASAVLQLPTVPVSDNITSSTAVTSSTQSSGNESSSMIIPHHALNVLPLWKIVGIVYFCGIFVLLVFLYFSYTIARTKFRNAERIKNDPVFELWRKRLHISRMISLLKSRNATSPITMGFINAKIILPQAFNPTEGEDAGHIYVHELMHVKRHDNLVSLFALAVVCANWFNPLLWISYRLFCRDLEFACDEKAIKKIGFENRAAYAKALLHAASYQSRKYPILTSAFGSSDLKNRVFNIMKPKISKLSISVCCLVSLLIVGSVFTFGSCATQQQSIKNPSLPISNALQSKNTKAAMNNSGIKEVPITAVDGSYSGYLLEINDPLRVKLAVTKYLGEAGESTSEMASENHAVAAINGGGFVDTNWEGNGSTPSDFVIQDGIVKFKTVSGDKKCEVIALNEKGQLIAGQYSINDLLNMHTKVMSAVTLDGYLPLVSNGKGTFQSADSSSFLGINPRTAIGQAADGTILMLVLDGRQPNMPGASLYDVQKIMLDHGAVTAANLDGGNSTTMYFNGSVINTPCGPLGERTVATAFYVQ